MELMRDLPRAGGRKTCVIVCGMHRTGTSATTRVINLLGAGIAEDLLTPGADNIRGFWESERILQVHEQLLHDLDSSSGDPLPLTDGWFGSPFARQARERLTDLIRPEFERTDLFVVKDPRISKLLPLWVTLLADLDVEVAVVMTFRNPLEVAASLEKRDRMQLNLALLLYLSSYLKAERASRGVSRCFVNYAHTIGDWRVLDSKLRSMLGARLPVLDDKRALAISQYLAPELRHHHHDRVELSHRDDVPRIVTDLYDLMSEAEAGDDDASLWRAFDRLSSSADGMSAMFRELLRNERKAFESSMSWRVTAPLRWLKHELQRK